MDAWIRRLFEEEALLGMGHCQRREDLNLGMGWLYYALARLFRPRLAVVIGSYRGFTPLVLAKALSDNLEGGDVYFIDPSLVDGFWKDPSAVREYFANFDVSNVRHFLMTTQQFVETDEYRKLHGVDMVFIDGYHTYEQARFDYQAFSHLVSEGGMILLHDSVRVVTTRIYGPDREYLRTVKYFVDELKADPQLQVFDIPLAEGLTLVRKTDHDHSRRSPARSTEGGTTSSNPPS